MNEFRINLLSGFIFVCSFIATTVLLIVKDAIRPRSARSTYNWTPFPRVRPEHVPNSNIRSADVCAASLHQPIEGIGCSMCSPDYVPTNVDAGEKVMFNGKTVPPGVYCLPQGKDDTGCGTFTGRATWSYDPDTGKQGWSCVCLYPNLFGGKQCLNNYACKDPSAGGPQTKNQLKDKDGNAWDPSDPNFEPTDSPLALNPDGTAKYTCSCDEPFVHGVSPSFVQMPGDPLRCHANPCNTGQRCEFVLPNKDIKFDPKTLQCYCGEEKDTGLSQYVHSNVDGRCHPVCGACDSYPGSGGMWDSKSKRCACKAGPNKAKCDADPTLKECIDKPQFAAEYFSKTCKSSLYHRDTYESKKECDGNPAGSACVDPCWPFPCMDPPGVNKDGADVCTATDDGDFHCACHPDGDQWKKRYGKHCEKVCYKDGSECGGRDDCNQRGCCNRPGQCFFKWYCGGGAYGLCKRGGPF